MKSKTLSFLSITVLAGAACGPMDIDPKVGFASYASTCMPSDPNALVFSRAVCLCGNLDNQGNGITSSSFSSFGTDEFSSRQGHVAINGSLTCSGNLEVDGSLAAGSGINTDGNLDVSNNLYCGGDLHANGIADIMGDASVRGDLVGAGIMSVEGQLTLAGSNQWDGLLEYGTLEQGAILQETPCPCGEEQLIDIAGAIAARRGAQSIDLMLDSGNHEIVLTAGDYYSANGMFMEGNADIVIQGAVRIFVENSMTLSGNTSITLDSGAELDLYIAGSLSNSGNLELGGDNTAASHALRLYIGGSAPVALDLDGNADIFAAIYAPRADLHYDGNLSVTGSLFARNLIGSGNVEVDYNAALVGLGEECYPEDATEVCTEENIDNCMGIDEQTDEFQPGEY